MSVKCLHLKEFRDSNKIEFNIIKFQEAISLLNHLSEVVIGRGLLNTKVASGVAFFWTLPVAYLKHSQIDDRGLINQHFCYTT